MITSKKQSTQQRVQECEVVCCTPFVCLPQAVEAAKGSHVKIGAENLHFEDKGAFTGEVSAEMLKDLGVDYVIMGHSERREYNNETDETVNLKAKKGSLKRVLFLSFAAVKVLNSVKPVSQMDWIAIQIKRHLPESALTTLRKLSLHTSRSGLSVQARLLLTTKLKKFAAVSENYLKNLYDAETAKAITIQYGGSMNPKNCAGLLAKPNIDGGLIGGASLKSADFCCYHKGS